MAQDDADTVAAIIQSENAASGMKARLDGERRGMGMRATHGRDEGLDDARGRIRVESGIGVGRDEGGPVIGRVGVRVRMLLLLRVVLWRGDVAAREQHVDEGLSRTSSIAVGVFAEVSLAAVGACAMESAYMRDSRKRGS